MSDQNTIQWAPKLRPHLLRRLYESDAQGLVDDELLNEVGYTLYERCRTIWIATERRCPECTAKLEQRDDSRDCPMICPACGWKTTWGLFHSSYKGKRIHGGSAYPAFVRYMEEWQRARDGRTKMLVIDRLVHALHEDKNKVWIIPASVNLIVGKGDEIFALLDHLAYGDCSAPESVACREQWRLRIEQGKKNRELYSEMQRRDGKRQAKEQWRLKIEQDQEKRY